jgi:O-succinylbenzoic acid--CoA ligase
LFTSGTTGKPKGVIYTHAARWVGEQMLKAAMPFVPQPQDALLLMTPFVHGASLLTFAWCDAGAHVVLHDGVNLAQIGPLLQRGAVQAVFAPPTVLAKITRGLVGQRIQGIQCIFTGTQALTPALYRDACAIFGPVVRITYGKSECINPITVLSPAQTHAHFEQADLPAGACVGWPVAGVELRVDRPFVGSGDPLPVDAVQGEIFLRAPQMCSALITPTGLIGHDHGWHATGDLGYVDPAGRLILTGRLADVIKTGGYRVNPSEIETALSGGQLHGGVCVTAIPSDYWGEVIIAVAQEAHGGWEVEARQQVATLSKHKRPRIYVTLDPLPRNAQGKVSRRAVALAVLQSHRLIDGPHPGLTPLATDDSGPLLA